MTSNGDIRVRLHCHDCPIGKRKHGSILFADTVRDFVFYCPRGHAFNVRRLTREERRANPTSSDWVAARWESGDLDERDDHGRT